MEENGCWVCLKDINRGLRVKRERKQNSDMWELEIGKNRIDQCIFKMHLEDQRKDLPARTIHGGGRQHSLG